MRMWIYIRIMTIIERRPADLVPREVLFGNPLIEAPKISPDGKSLLFLAPHEGKQSVWVRTMGGQDDRLIAHNSDRPIAFARWQRDGKHVLFLQDDGGNENFHLFRVGLSGGTPVDLTPSEHGRAMPIALDDRHPNEVLLTLNARKATLFDVYRLDLAKGGILTLDTENPGDVLHWLADQEMLIRAAVAQLPDGSYVIRVRDVATAPWRTLDKFMFSDGAPRLVTFSPDNAKLYVISAKDANATRLVRYDLTSERRDIVFEDSTFDVERVHVDPATREIAAVAVLRVRLEWTSLTSPFDADFDTLAQIHDGDIGIDSVSADGESWIVRYQSAAAPDHYYLYERSRRRATFAFCDRPALADYQLAPMEPFAFTARDGLELHGYLTLPVGIVTRALPTVLYVHGGPWYRDRWGYEPVVQWLANRGYAVLQVNFRGSTGYGKTFLNAGNREWAGAMRTDLLDAREWAIRQGYADPTRIAIFGGSYGGYAVLTALAWTPDLFACGIDIVGPSDLRTFLASLPRYWEPMRKMFSERVGDDPEFLESQSPLLKASYIKAPLLIAQGANDPRVKRQESDQMVAALRARGVPVEYVVFDNEGHGIASPTNLTAFMAHAERFLARTLAGRVEPPANDDITPFLN